MYTLHTTFLDYAPCFFLLGHSLMNQKWPKCEYRWSAYLFSCLKSVFFSLKPLNGLKD